MASDDDKSMDYLDKIFSAFELHSVEGIRECFENGISPNQLYNDKPLINQLLNMYTRGPLFKNCIQVFVDYGLEFDDKILLSVLLDNADLLNDQLSLDKSYMEQTYSFSGAFTPIYNVSLLHICAEYNHVSTAEILIKHGADIDSKAGIDEYGFGGQTPIFHTVNQDANKSFDMMKLLIRNGADLLFTVRGLIWGKGYEWETFIPAINPISYAMMGLLPQFQRKERDIYEVVTYLLDARYGLKYYPENIPNKYLKRR